MQTSVPVYLRIPPFCATSVDSSGLQMTFGWCGEDCPVDESTWGTDDTLRVTTHWDYSEILWVIAGIGILATSILIIAALLKSCGIHPVLESIHTISTNL